LEEIEEIQLLVELEKEERGCVLLDIHTFEDEFNAEDGNIELEKRYINNILKIKDMMSELVFESTDFLHEYPPRPEISSSKSL
jgi:hypothetical protein